MSVFTMIGSLAMPVGIMFFGPLADVVDINYLMIGTGAAVVVLGGAYLSSRTLRLAGAPSGTPAGSSVATEDPVDSASGD
jgi:DHA3 family macrolide efflux protein-like MFS transporter